MKQFVVFANCQGAALAKTLLESKDFAAAYTWLTIPSVHEIKTPNIPQVLKKIERADLFIYQPVGSEPHRPKELTSAFLLNRLKGNAMVLSFPSLYFDGYFPHLQTLNGAVSVLNLVHDYVIAYACAIGINEQDLFALIRQTDFYPQDISIDLAQQSLANLRNREQLDNVDIAVTDYLVAHYQQRKLFNQFNHPKRELFVFVAQAILHKLGINEPLAMVKNNGSHLDMIMTPIYPSTHTNLALAFQEDFDTYSGIGATKFSQREVIKQFFAFYHRQDTNAIKSLVLKRKPFVAKILQRHGYVDKTADFMSRIKRLFNQ